MKSEFRPQRVVVVGGGASGTLLAIHLGRIAPAMEITLVEKRENIGRGRAYSTQERWHLLNVPAANMSAFPGDSEHFYRWARANDPSADAGDGETWFAPRRLYGLYLEDTLRQTNPHAIVVHDCAVEADETAEGVSISLASGKVLQADVLVLATGYNDESSDQPFRLPYEPMRLRGDASIAILGTGLTMVDAVMTLLETGNGGPITAFSRRGLLPRAHNVAPPRMMTIDLPIERGLAVCCGLLRDKIAADGLVDLDWRDAIDGLRPHTQRIWQSMPLEMQRRFLEHARPWWDVHRHRIAPAISQKLDAAVENDRLDVFAGRLKDFETTPAGFRLTIGRRGRSVETTADFDAVFQCAGVSCNPARSSNPIVRALMMRKALRADPLCLGFDVDPDCRLISQQGGASKRMFAIGPPTSGRFWEIIAIPDIRVQTDWLAHRIAAVQ